MIRGINSRTKSEYPVSVDGDKGGEGRGTALEGKGEGV